MSCAHRAPYTMSLFGTCPGRHSYRHKDNRSGALVVEDRRRPAGSVWTVGPGPCLGWLVRHHGLFRESEAPGDRCAHGSRGRPGNSLVSSTSAGNDVGSQRPRRRRCVGIAGWACLSAFLYGVSGCDPLSLGTASLVLLVVALAACYLPARSASRVDPLVALRGA
jgi:hypothetical protein